MSGTAANPAFVQKLLGHFHRPAPMRCLRNHRGAPGDSLYKVVTSLKQCPFRPNFDGSYGEAQVAFVHDSVGISTHHVQKLQVVSDRMFLAVAWLLLSARFIGLLAD